MESQRVDTAQAAVEAEMNKITVYLIVRVENMQRTILAAYWNQKTRDIIFDHVARAGCQCEEIDLDVPTVANKVLMSLDGLQRLLLGLPQDHSWRA